MLLSLPKRWRQARLCRMLDQSVLWKKAATSRRRGSRQGGSPTALKLSVRVAKRKIHASPPQRTYHFCDVEVEVEIFNLREVLALHGQPGLAHATRIGYTQRSTTSYEPTLSRKAAWITLCRVDELVDYDVVCVNLHLGKLLHEPLRLVQRQKLGGQHAHKRRFVLFRSDGSF